MTDIIKNTVPFTRMRYYAKTANRKFRNKCAIIHSVGFGGRAGGGEFFLDGQGEVMLLLAYIMYSYAHIPTT